VYRRRQSNTENGDELIGHHHIADVRCIIDGMWFGKRRGSFHEGRSHRGAAVIFVDEEAVRVVIPGYSM
jgi:hypothetical protein